jgi:hypothetical protein
VKAEGGTSSVVGRLVFSARVYYTARAFGVGQSDDDAVVLRDTCQASGATAADAPKAVTNGRKCFSPTFSCR